MEAGESNRSGEDEEGEEGSIGAQRGAMEIVAVFLALAVTSLLAARLSGTSVRRSLARNFALGAATMGLTLLGGWLLPM